MSHRSRAALTFFKGYFSRRTGELRKTSPPCPDKLRLVKLNLEKIIQ